MMNSSKKMFDQIFELKFMKSQLAKESKRCEDEEKSHKTKAKKSMEKGDMESAKLYAQNAIRKKGEALNYLQLASRLDAVISRLTQQSRMSQLNKSMVGIVGSMSRAMKDSKLEDVVANMKKFEKECENLDVRTAVLDGTMNQQAMLSTPPDQVNDLLQKIADENQLEVQLELPKPGTTEMPTQIAAPQETNSLEARLAALRGG